MVPEEELEEIFREKLYIQPKKTAAREECNKENIDTIEGGPLIHSAGSGHKAHGHGSAGGQEQRRLGEVSANIQRGGHKIEDRNGEGHDREERVVGRENEAVSFDGRIPPEVSLQGIYQGMDAVYEMKRLIETGRLRYEEDGTEKGTLNREEEITKKEVRGKDMPEQVVEDDVNNLQEQIEEGSELVQGNTMHASQRRVSFVREIEQRTAHRRDSVPMANKKSEAMTCATSTAGPSSANDTGEIKQPEHKKDCTCREIEREFNKLKVAHVEALRMKSKLYKIVTVEVCRLEDHYREMIERLEARNKELEEEARGAKKKYERFKLFVEDNVKKLYKRFGDELRKRRMNMAEQGGAAAEKAPTGEHRRG